MNAQQFAKALLNDYRIPNGAEISVSRKQKTVDFCREKILASVDEQQRRILERCPAVVLFSNDTDAGPRAVLDSPDEVVFILSFRLIQFLEWILNSGVWFATKSILDDRKALAELGHALCQMFAFNLAHRRIGDMPEFMLREPLDWQLMLVGSVSSITFTLGHEMGHVLQARGDKEMREVRKNLEGAKLPITSQEQMDELVSDHFGARCVLHSAGINRQGLLEAAGPFMALAYTSAMQCLLMCCESLIPAARDHKDPNEIIARFDELSNYPMANVRHDALLCSGGIVFTEREIQFGEFLSRMVGRALEYMDDEESTHILSSLMNILGATG